MLEHYLCSLCFVNFVGTLPYVDSHSQNLFMPYTVAIYRWKDVTDMERLQQAIEYDMDRGKICFLKVTLVKLLLFAAEGAAGTQGGLESYRMQRDQFLMQEGHRDAHTSMKTMLEGTWRREEVRQL